MVGRALARSLFEDCWTGGRLDLLTTLLAVDHCFHTADGDIEGIDDCRALVDCYRRAFGPVFEFRHLLCEDELVALHYDERGAFEHDWILGDESIPATGRSYQTFGVELMRIEDGRIAEAWPGHESLSHWIQIDVARFSGVSTAEG